MNKVTELIIMCIGSIVYAIVTLILVSILCTCVCFGVETKQVKKPVSQSTSRENAIRKQMYNACVQSGENRAKCYYLFY